METLKKLDNCIYFRRIKGEKNDWCLYPNPESDIRLWKVTASGKCNGICEYPGITKGWNTIKFCTVINPRPGCMVIARIDKLEPITGLSELIGAESRSRTYHSGYSAFVFDAKVFQKSWKIWERPHDVQVRHDDRTIHGLEIAIMASHEKELVRVKSSGHGHELLTFGHILDYCAGVRSLADIMAILGTEERLHLSQERRPAYEELLQLIRKFKGADPGRSKTAKRMEDLLMKLAG